MAQLSPHFTLEELLHSDAAVKVGIPNVFPPELLNSLKRTVNMLEQCRDILGVPIHVDSCFRSPAVNELVGGSPTSAHLRALAADIVPIGMPLIDAARKLVMHLPSYDQIILEAGWIHVGLATSGRKARMQVLTKFKGDPEYYLGLRTRNK